MGKPGGSTPWLDLRYLELGGISGSGHRRPGFVSVQLIFFKRRGPSPKRPAVIVSVIRPRTQCFARFAQRRLCAEVPAIFHEYILRLYYDGRVH